MKPWHSKVDDTECKICKEPLNLVRVKAWRDEPEEMIEVEVESGEKHVCFHLPEDANLIVLGD